MDEKYGKGYYAKKPPNAANRTNEDNINHPYMTYGECIEYEAV